MRLKETGGMGRCVLKGKMIMEDMMIYWIGLLIKEYGPEVKGSTATCYNPVTAGSYFAAWWWAEGRQNNQAYLAEFIQDY